MKKYNLITMLLLLAGAWFTTTNAQVYYFNKVWEKDFGGYNSDVLDGSFSLLLDNDSNIIVLGSSNTSISGNKTINNCGGSNGSAESDIWLLKLHQDGTKFYENTYGGLQGDGAVCGLVNQDGTLTIGGQSDSHVSCSKSENRFGGPDYWILKLDTAGQKIWDHRYGGQLGDWLVRIQSSNDGSIIAIGHSDTYSGGNITDTSNGQYDLLIFKLDSVGGIIWNYFYGSPYYEIASDGIIDSGNNIVISAITNCIAPGLGDVSSGGYDTPANLSIDNWIVKIDPSGNKIWDKRYGCYNEDDALSIIQNRSGEYVITARITDSCIGGNVSDTIPRGGADIWIYKLDSATGNIISDKRIGGNHNDFCYSIKQLSDDGYLLACTSNSNAGFDKSENACNSSFNDFWVIRTDSAFNIMWDKTIGGYWDEWGPNVIVLNDSTFIIGGSTYSGIGFDKTVPLFDTSSGMGTLKQDIWIMKWTVTTVDGINENNILQFSIYPNPVSSALYIELPYPALKLKNVNAVITDVAGRTVYSNEFDTSKQTQIVADVSSLSKGIYFIRIGNVVKKFVKM